jgi:hypothetical protein
MDNKHNLEFRELKGTECHKLHEKIDLVKVLADHKNSNRVSNIWKNFYSTMQLVKEKKIKSCELKKQNTKWLKEFTSVYQRDAVTPYMHIYVFHLYQFVEMYGNVEQYNAQGVEKLNDLLRQGYFRGTNKHKDADQQLLMKRSRIEWCFEE